MRPIVTTLDLHANLTETMVRATNALVAYRTNPHLDQRERGQEAARLIARMIRGEVIADLLEQNAADRARRAHFSRWYEWRGADVDLDGALLDQLRQMSPDDWHEIALRWDWDQGIEALSFITAQRTCDRATAVYILCCARPGLIATTLDQGRNRKFVLNLAAKLENGFYPNADLGLELTMRMRRDFELEIETARATGDSPWRLTNDLITHLDGEQIVGLWRVDADRRSSGTPGVDPQRRRAPGKRAVLLCRHR